ncbi:MAG: MFS transporter [Clostridium sp.]|uniref:MFS transporter n=1 Tax=Clostridium sp. TaxID=1506 RepID=UPI00302651E7
MKYRKPIMQKLGVTFPALTYKNFRWFWFGQCVSLIGSWVQTTTQGWLVLQIVGENTGFSLGVINALQFTPVMLFSLFAGVIIDRFSKRKILIFTQIGLMVMALIQAALVFTGVIQFWQLAIIALIVGCINTIDMPARQSFVIELVGKDSLMNGIALNSTAFNGARILGPAVAGIIIAYVGIEMCYFINAISFIPVIYGIYKINVAEVKSDKNKDMLREIKDGLSYIKGNRILVKTFAMISVMGIFAFNYNILIPLFAVDVLGLTSKGYGFLMSALGVGSLVGAVTVAAKSKRGPRYKVIVAAAYIVSLILVILGINRQKYIMAGLLAFIGIFNIAFSTSANSTVQLNSKDEYRGRVMSVYTLFFAGVAPIGSLFTGTIANGFGPARAFVLSGIIASICITAINLFDKFWKKEEIR